MFVKKIRVNLGFRVKLKFLWTDPFFYFYRVPKIKEKKKGTDSKTPDMCVISKNYLRTRT